MFLVVDGKDKALDFAMFCFVCVFQVPSIEEASILRDPIKLNNVGVN